MRIISNVRNTGRRVSVFLQNECHRALTEKDGAVNTLEVVGIAVVVLVAVVALGAVLQTRFPELGNGLIDKVKALLGL